MKLKHKILTLIAGTLTTFALTSCNDFLDRDPLGQFTEDDAPNALIGGKMYNVYYLMRSYNITAGIPAFMIHMVRSEDSEKRQRCRRRRRPGSHVGRLPVYSLQRYAQCLLGTEL